MEIGIPVTGSEVDARVFGHLVSAREIERMGRVKIAWTVDTRKARELREEYSQSHDGVSSSIKWGGIRKLADIPLEYSSLVTLRRRSL